MALIRNISHACSARINSLHTPLQEAFDSVWIPFTLVFLVCLIGNTSPVPVFAFTGQVVGVSDGDTIAVMHEGKAEKVRLTGIDCPEKGQAFGKAAKRFVSEQVFGKVVTVEVKGTDKYQRT